VPFRLAVIIRCVLAPLPAVLVLANVACYLTVALITVVRLLTGNFQVNLDVCKVDKLSRTYFLHHSIIIYLLKYSYLHLLSTNTIE
jgi:hypothetical protein